jgi:hypothetical protein
MGEQGEMGRAKSKMICAEAALGEHGGAAVGLGQQDCFKTALGDHLYYILNNKWEFLFF